MIGRWIHRCRASVILFAAVIAAVMAAALFAVMASRGVEGERAPSGRAVAAESKPVTVVVGGDVLLGRGVEKRAQNAGWAKLLAGVSGKLRTADLAVVNLESPLGVCLPGGSVNRPRLCGDERGVAALKAASVDAVTLANNHALDAGKDGLLATARILRRHGIAPLGVTAALTGRPNPERLGPITVVSANLTRTVHPPGSHVPVPTPEALHQAVLKARQGPQRRPVLVVLHAGRELDPYPGTRDRVYAQAAVRAGASAVVMHGAHVIRPLMYDRSVPVHLGLGNLLFDQRDPRARYGALVTLRFTAGRPARVQGLACADSLSGSAVPCGNAGR